MLQLGQEAAGEDAGRVGPGHAADGGDRLKGHVSKISMGTAPTPPL